MGYCKEQEPTSFSVSNIFDTSSRIFASTCSWHLYTRQQTNKQTNKQELKLNALDADHTYPHIPWLLLVQYCTVWLLQNVSSRLLQLLLDGWVNEGPNLTKINTQWLQKWLPTKNKQTNKIFVHGKFSYSPKVLRCTKTLSHRKMFFLGGWSVHDILFDCAYNSPNIPNPHHQGNDVPCIQTHVN